jgi:DNA-binding response OmpR family regulator
MVIDDSPIVRDMIADILVDSGYVVLAAASAAQGFARIAEEPVDMIVTDLKLPDMSGLEVGRRCRERFPAIRVGIITGWIETVDAKTLDECGVDFIIGKPVSARDLRALVAASLERQAGQA